jgi:hypothetical protein
MLSAVLLTRSEKPMPYSTGKLRAGLFVAAACGAVLSAAAKPASAQTISPQSVWSQFWQGCATATAVQGSTIVVAGCTGIGEALAGQTSAGGGDAFVRKLDAAGRELWIRQFGSAQDDSAEGIAFSPAGDIYVVGQTAGGIDSPNSGETDAFIRKYDADGNVLWTRQFGSPAGDEATEVATDPAGGIYVAGSTDGSLPGKASGGQRDGFVVKYDEDGTLLWSHQFAGSLHDEAKDVAADGSGVYVAGAVQLQVSPPRAAAIVWKFSASGDPLWETLYQAGEIQPDSSYSPYATALAVETTGVYLAGRLIDASSPWDGFAARLGVDGAKIWSRVVAIPHGEMGAGDTAILDVTADSGGIYLTGHLSRLAMGRHDATVWKYSHEGELLWLLEFGSPSFDRADGIAANGDGSVNVVGITAQYGAFVTRLTPPVTAPPPPSEPPPPPPPITITPPEGSAPAPPVETPPAVSVSGLSDPAPAAGPEETAFTLAPMGGLAISSRGASLTSTARGYVRIRPGAGSVAPAGVAIYSFRPGAYLVSETGVPAVRPLAAGRFYAEVAGAVTTGVALVNPNSQAVTVTFFFTDENGNEQGNGSFSVPAGGQISEFLDGPVLKRFSGPSFRGTFSFSSTAPVAAVALRTLINERSDPLTATLPVVDTSVSPRIATMVLPHFAEGGGWTSQILLVNPANTTVSGTLEFRDDSGALTPVAVAGQTGGRSLYSIPPRSSRRFISESTSGIIRSSSVQVIPGGSTPAPSALVLFSYRPGGVTLSEAAAPAIGGASLRMLVEASYSSAPAANLQSAVAIANPNAASVTLTLELTDLNGDSTGLTTTRQLPPQTRLALFLDELFAGRTLPDPLRGILRVQATGGDVFAIAIRTRYNERGDFLIATTPPVSEALPAAPGDTFFPLLADGGGYTTQFFLFEPASSPRISGTLRFAASDGAALTLEVNR